MSEQAVSGENLSAPATFPGQSRYILAANTALEYYTGDPNTFLDYDTTQKLATTIQDAVELIPNEKVDGKETPMVPKKLAELEQQVTGVAKVPVKTQELLQTLREAQDAAGTLVKCNLKHAKHRVDASMNLVNGFVPPSFMDIRRLRSPTASYGDRIQVANYGLVKAAWKYKPNMRTNAGAPLHFLAFANEYIDAELYKWVLGDEGSVVHVDARAHQSIQRASSKGKELPERQQTEIAQYENLRQPLPVHLLTDEDMPPEYGDPTYDQATAIPTPLEIRRLLKCLPSDKERDIVIAHYGLFGHPEELQREIAERYGVSYQNIGWFLNKAKKLMAQTGVVHGYLGEPFEDLLPDTAVGKARGRRVTNRLEQIILQSPGSFRSSSKSRTNPSPALKRAWYPDSLVQYITTEFEGALRSRHVEQAWNESFEQLSGKLEDRLAHRFNIDRLTQLFSRLLRETMTEDDELTIRIPEKYRGKLHYVGAWATKGFLEIEGNPGNYTGAFASGSAITEVTGSVGKYCGLSMHDQSTLKVSGFAGSKAAAGIYGAAAVVVGKSVGNHAGFGMASEHTRLIVKGNAGWRVASSALAGRIIVQGTAKSVEIREGSNVEVVCGHVKDAYEISEYSNSSSKHLRF